MTPPSCAPATPTSTKPAPPDTANAPSAGRPTRTSLHEANARPWPPPIEPQSLGLLAEPFGGGRGGVGSWMGWIGRFRVRGFYGRRSVAAGVAVSVLGEDAEQT